MTPTGTAWMGAAACATPEHRSLPWTTDSPALPANAAALMQRVCAGCPVLAACAAHAAATEVTGGFWAGADRAHLRLDTTETQLAMDLGGAA